MHASVEQVANLSAHADAAEFMTWLGGFQQAQRRTFVVHGESQASDALRQHIERDLHWAVTMPEYRQSYPLD